MRTLLLLVLVVLHSHTPAHAGGLCAWRELVGQVDGLAPIKGAPPIAPGARFRFASISLHEPVGSTDQYLYSALLDARSGQAWVRRYGGFAGAIEWFGPTAANPERLSSCAASRLPVWFGRAP